MTTSPSTAERAQETASTAADEGRHVAGVAKDEAAAVASEAVDHARNLMAEAVSQVSDQVGEQSRAQRDRLVDTLQSVGDDLQQMASRSETPGLAADLAREVAGRTHALSSHLDGREPGQLLDDVRTFARNRPGTFLLGALAAGVVAGRLVRGAKEGGGTADTPTVTTPATTGITPGQATMQPTASTFADPAPATPSFADPAPTTPSFADPAPTTPSFADPAHTNVLDVEAPMGTAAAGYGERGAFDEERL